MMLEHMSAERCASTWNLETILYMVIEIPVQVTEIDDEAFDGCDATLVVHSGSFAETFVQEHGVTYRIV